MRFARDRGLEIAVRGGGHNVAGTAVCDGTIPSWPTVSRELHFRPAIAVASCYAGPVEDGERAVRAPREFGTPLVDLVGPTRYVDHQSSIDDTVPHGWHYRWKATDLTGMSDEVIDIVASTPTAQHRRGRAQ